jgi:hypothetical protein
MSDSALSFLRPPAVRILLGLATIVPFSEARAGEPASLCGNAISILNEGQIYDAFDKLNGGGDRRLRFRLDGQEPCAAGACKAEAKADGKVEAKTETKPDIKAEGGAEGKPETRAAGGAESKPEAKAATRVEIVSRASAAEKVIATIDLKGRAASYCLSGVRRVDIMPAQRRDGCPPHYLLNFLTVKLVDADGPFARRDINIQYVYRADAGAVSLDRCAPRAILDGMFRRRAWTVALEDGSAAFIGEIDFPRDRRVPLPPDSPFATSVVGAPAGVRER